MSVQAVYLDWRRDQRSLAADVQAAVERFQQRTGLPATHLFAAPGTGNPPPGCTLIWRESQEIRPGVLRVGVVAEGAL